jgi:cardiolipin synthase
LGRAEASEPWHDSGTAVAFLKSEVHVAEQLFFDGKEYFDSLLEGIRQATRSVDFETYIFEDDGIGERVLAALTEAATRGVKVRLLVDGFGSRKSAARIATRLAGTGVQFRVYHPIRFAKALCARRALLRMNRRDHRKVCRIDSSMAWVGSFNVSDVHLKASRGHGPWRDSAIQVGDRSLEPLALAFDRAWTGRSLPNVAMLASDPGILLNCTYLLRRSRNRELADRIRGARERVWIVTPYFSPDHHVRKALREAGRRGVDVRILLPKASDSFGMPWVNAHFSKRLSRDGVSFFLYKPTFLHAKFAIVDEWAALGSANLNHRSLHHDLEVDVVAREPETIRTLDAQFLLDLKSAEALPPASPGEESSLLRIWDAFVHSMRDWT